MSRLDVTTDCTDCEARIRAEVIDNKTDNITKSNFNPQMLKSCTDTAYQCGYQQGGKDAIEEVMDELLKLPKVFVDSFDYISVAMTIKKLEQLKEKNK